MLIFLFIFESLQHNLMFEYKKARIANRKILEHMKVKQNILWKYSYPFTASINRITTYMIHRAGLEN